MTKYIIGEYFSSGGATLYKNASDQTVRSLFSVCFVLTSSIIKGMADVGCFVIVSDYKYTLRSCGQS